MLIPNINFALAMDSAHANANYFGRPYIIFRDSSGNTRVERASSFYMRLDDSDIVVYPEIDIKDSNDR